MLIFLHKYQIYKLNIFNAIPSFLYADYIMDTIWVFILCRNASVLLENVRFKSVSFNAKCTVTPAYEGVLHKSLPQYKFISSIFFFFFFFFFFLKKERKQWRMAARLHRSYTCKYLPPCCSYFVSVFQMYCKTMECTDFCINIIIIIVHDIILFFFQ